MFEYFDILFLQVNKMTHYETQINFKELMFWIRDYNNVVKPLVFLTAKILVSVIFNL